MERAIRLAVYRLRPSYTEQYYRLYINFSWALFWVTSEAGNWEHLDGKDDTAWKHRYIRSNLTTRCTFLNSCHPHLPQHPRPHDASLLNCRPNSPFLAHARLYLLDLTGSSIIPRCCNPSYCISRGRDWRGDFIAEFFSSLGLYVHEGMYRVGMLDMWTCEDIFLGDLFSWDLVQGN